jgi:hypothetical protein
MQRLTRRPGAAATLAGLLFFLVAAWLFLWAASSASSRCAACECRYELTAADAACRLPAVLALVFLASITAAVASLAVGGLQHRRASKKAQRDTSDARPVRDDG